MNHSFGKKYRLCSKIAIDHLFKEGKSIKHNCFRIIYIAKRFEPKELKFLISIPKKNLKKAVDRNKIKRRIKEICRLDILDHLKNEMDSSIYFHVAIIYQNKELMGYKELQENLLKAMERVIKKIKDDTNN